MRVFLLILIAIVVGSAAGSMASWVLISDPQPLAVATNAAVQNAPVATPPREIDSSPEPDVAAKSESETRPRPTGSDSLDQQAREMEQMRQRAEREEAASAVEPPVVESANPEPAKSAAPANRPARTSIAPLEPKLEPTRYILPVGIGLIAAIVAFVAANRLLSQDI